MDLSIIIVSFNTQVVLAECLESILKSGDKLSKEIIVVDNASTDNSVAIVKSKFPGVKVIENSKNLGFAKANNIGVKNAKGKYVLLLNSDTVLRTDTLELLIDKAISHNSKIASCELLNPDGSLQPQGGYIPKLRHIAAWMLFLDDLIFVNKLIKPYQQRRASYFEKDQHPGWLSGTALLIDRDYYLKTGGLDENLFMYGEDVEFCLRAGKDGVRIDYFSEPSLVHIGQASGSSKKAILGEFKGLLYIFKKHKPAWELPILRLLLLMGAGLRWLIFGLIMGNKDKREAYGQAIGLV